MTQHLPQRDGNAKTGAVESDRLIDMGATGVSICLALPTIMGRDSDDPLAEVKVGSCRDVKHYKRRKRRLS